MPESILRSFKVLVVTFALHIAFIAIYMCQSGCNHSLTCQAQLGNKSILPKKTIFKCMMRFIFQLSGQA